MSTWLDHGFPRYLAKHHPKNICKCISEDMDKVEKIILTRWPSPNQEKNQIELSKEALEQASPAYLRCRSSALGLELCFRTPCGWVFRFRKRKTPSAILKLPMWGQKSVEDCLNAFTAEVNLVSLLVPFSLTLTTELLYGRQRFRTCIWLSQSWLPAF